MNAPAGPVIEVFADIWCPFAHVGLRAIEEQRARAGRTDVAIWVRAWPLELVNGVQLDPTVTWEHAEDLRDQVAAEPLQSPRCRPVPDFDPRGPGPGQPGLSDRPAGRRAGQLRPAGRAVRGGPGHLGPGDARVPGPRPRRCPCPTGRTGLPCVADWDEGQRRGVLGSPHFFCGDTDVFCPSLDITKDPVDGLSVVRDVSRLTAFMERCLAQTRPRHEPTDPGTRD